LQVQLIEAAQRVRRESNTGKLELQLEIGRQESSSMILTNTSKNIPADIASRKLPNAIGKRNYLCHCAISIAIDGISLGRLFGLHFSRFVELLLIRELSS
jgi:hypothetical protein